MEFNRESLGLLGIRGENGLRELARQRGVQVVRGANKRDIIDALMRSLPNTAFTEGYNVNRAAPPPPPGMSQEQAKVEIKRRLDIMAREIYDKIHSSRPHSRGESRSQNTTKSAKPQRRLNVARHRGRYRR